MNAQFPEYTLGGEGSASRYRHYDEGRGLNYYEADPNLRAVLTAHPIWEGTSNLCALDLWRAIVKQRGHEVVLAHVEQLLDRLESDAAQRLAVVARQAVLDVREAIRYLSCASSSRQAQQARRLADLVGDTVALAALAHEADVEAREGDHRKALVSALFAMRMNRAETRRTAVTDAFDGVPDLYPTLFAEDAVPEAGCAATLERLARSCAPLSVAAGG